MALVQDLFDNFDDNVLDASKWTSYGSGFAETSGQAQITCAIGGGYSGLNSNGRFNLTGSSARIQVVNAGNQTLTSLEAFPLQLNADGSNKLQWRINSGNIMARRTVAGVTTDTGSTAYSSVTHKYVRIRESGGTTFWDYSADGITWANLTSIANPITITNIQYDIGAGTFATEASATTVIYDNLNISSASVAWFSA